MPQPAIAFPQSTSRSSFFQKT